MILRFAGRARVDVFEIIFGKRRLIVCAFKQRNLSFEFGVFSFQRLVLIVSSVFSIKSKIFYFLFKIALKIDEKPSVIPSKPTTLAENGYTFDGR